jgi:opacity protein-like surface antigen
MKKLLTTVAALGIVLGSTAAIAGGPDNMSAQPALTGFYVGAGVGYGALSGSSISAISSAARDLHVKTTDSGVVFDAHLGYNINRYFGAQLEYMYLPQLKFSFDGASASINNNFIALEAKGQYPLMDDKVVPFVTAGYGIVINSASGDNADSTSEWEPVLGLGVEYKVTPNIGVNVQYKVVINANDNFANVNMGLVGANYYF